ncbi:hypothetical protein [Mycetocola miduiensis]|uniref:Uncharacterized protein n=1 Tax=Mycetocola miduiensis TaxID=995034 RepID=A0A1I5CVA6_9MICO|nr:hypothetical protein [Mycetocola miduiensis]SFN90878.1 hypothetical protein SAMN05216219_2599 [Mycetocola miduiensis]
METLNESGRGGTLRNGSFRRRIGFSAAIVVNAVLLGLVNGWPGWRAVPILTGEADSVVLVFNLALVVGILVNTVNMIADIRWVRAVGEIITSAVALVFLTQLLRVFPFSFSDGSVDWAFVIRTVLWFAVAGCVISILVSGVIVVREVTRNRQDLAEQQS